MKFLLLLYLHNVINKYSHSPTRRKGCILWNFTQVKFCIICNFPKFIIFLISHAEKNIKVCFETYSKKIMTRASIKENIL